MATGAPTKAPAALQSSGNQEQAQGLRRRSELVSPRSLEILGPGVATGIVGGYLVREDRSMKAGVRLADLAALPAPERQAKLRELSAATRRLPNGELASLEAEIRAYEVRHGIDSETLRREVNAGKRQETWEVCRWLMVLDELERLRALAPR